MQTTLNVLGSYWPILAVVLLVACYKLVLRMFGMIVIPQDSIGIVNKKWVLFGKNKSLPDGCRCSNCQHVAQSERNRYGEKIMRAHEKMLLNSKLMQAVPYIRHDGVGRGCALGMMEGGHITISAFGTPDTAETQYPWLKDKAAMPCTCQPVYSAMTNAHVIAHLFNEHVCKNQTMHGYKVYPNAEPWTLEQLADYIKSIDPTVDPDEELICEQETSHDQTEVKA